MHISLPSPVLQLIETLNRAGFAAYAVGGCVRDALRGVTPPDFDIATDATPEQVTALFADERVVATGLAHGTVTVILSDLPMEVTTFRKESGYGDHRHPDSVQFTSQLKEDLARRDFTVNAMAYHPAEGLMDFFGGQADLENRIIRCVGDPDERFNEDALRILRALRFASVLGFTIEPATAKALHSHREDLGFVANERICAELLKLLCGQEVATILREYVDVITTILPELTDCVGFEQHSRYHIYDVYEHTLHSVAAIPNDPILRFTMLLHDSGKPLAFTQEPDGTGHFYGHGTHSVRLAEQAMRRLRVSNAFFEQVSTLICYHDLRFESTIPFIKRWLNRLGEDTLRKLFKVQAADCAAQAPNLLGRLDGLRRLEELLNEVITQQGCFSLKDLAVNGTDLLALGVPADATLGTYLNRLLDAVIDEQCENERTALLNLVRRCREEGINV